MNQNANDYTGLTGARQGRTFVPFNRGGCADIEVLECLKGKIWDEKALGLVHSLRPSHLRVIETGKGEQIDAQTWRVTVWLNKDKTIWRICQEVLVGLPEDCENGYDLMKKLFDAKG